MPYWRPPDVTNENPFDPLPDCPPPAYASRPGSVVEPPVYTTRQNTLEPPVYTTRQNTLDLQPASATPSSGNTGRARRVHQPTSGAHYHPELRGQRIFEFVEDPCPSGAQVHPELRRNRVTELVDEDSATGPGPATDTSTAPLPLRRRDRPGFNSTLSVTPRYERRQEEQRDGRARTRVEERVGRRRHQAPSLQPTEERRRYPADQPPHLPRPSRPQPARATRSPSPSIVSEVPSRPTHSRVTPTSSSRPTMPQGADSGLPRGSPPGGPPYPSGSGSPGVPPGYGGQSGSGRGMNTSGGSSHNSSGLPGPSGGRGGVSGRSPINDPLGEILPGANQSPQSRAQRMKTTISNKTRPIRTNPYAGATMVSLVSSLFRQAQDHDSISPSKLS